MLYDNKFEIGIREGPATAGETSQIVRETKLVFGGLVINTASGNEIVCPHAVFKRAGGFTTVIAANEHLSRWPSFVLVKLTAIRRYRFEFLEWCSEEYSAAAGLFAPSGLCNIHYAQSNFKDCALAQTMNLWLRQ